MATAEQAAGYSKGSCMALEITATEIEGITLFRPKGRLVFGQEASALQDAVQQSLSGGKTKIILSLKDVLYIDSTGLGVLVVAHSAAEKENGSIRLVHLSKRHIDLLTLTKLTALFQLFDDEQAAVDSFFPDRVVKHFDILEFVKSQENKPQE